MPHCGIYDNMKTAVDKVRNGKLRDVTARFAAMVGHYLFEAEFCNPASGWEKGQTEKNVQDAAIGFGRGASDTYAGWAQRLAARTLCGVMARVHPSDVAEPDDRLGLAG